MSLLRLTQIKQHLRYMQSQGYTRNQVLAHARIDAKRLDDPTYLVELDQFHTVVLNMLRLTGDDGLGLKLGSSTTFNDLGAVGYAMATASTLGEVISLWLQYGRSPVGFPFTVDLIPSDSKGQWGVSSSRFDMSLSVYRFYIEETIAMGQIFCSMLTGLKVQFGSIELAYPAPSYFRRYERQFGCKPKFEAPQTRFTMTWPPLSAPTNTQDSELREMCIRHCSRLARQIERRGPISVRIREYLKARGAVPSLDETAADLNMSGRTLRHHLSVEGTTFQTLLDEFRCDLAQEYLGTQVIPIKQIADLLGFSHTDSFARAFKCWTGKTPGEFQTSLRPPRQIRTSRERFD